MFHPLDILHRSWSPAASTQSRAARRRYQERVGDDQYPWWETLDHGIRGGGTSRRCFETCAHRGRRNACVTERISIATADGRLQLHAAGHQQLPKRHLFILAPNTRQRRCMPSSSPAHYAKAGLGSSRLLLPCFPRLPLVRLFR